MVKVDQAAGLRQARPSWQPLSTTSDRAAMHRFSIAITSGKGGVGKTQMAANLAVALAQRGRKLLLLDADLGLAGLDLALGVTPIHNLSAVIEGRMKPEDILTEGPLGIRLLPASPGRYEMATFAERPPAALSTRCLCSASFDVLLTEPAPASHNPCVRGQLRRMVLLATPARSRCAPPTDGQFLANAPAWRRIRFLRQPGFREAGRRAARPLRGLSASSSGRAHLPRLRSARLACAPCAPTACRSCCARPKLAARAVQAMRRLLALDAARPRHAESFPSPPTTCPHMYSEKPRLDELVTRVCRSCAARFRLAAGCHQMSMWEI